MARPPNPVLVAWLVYTLVNLHVGVFAFRSGPPFRQHNPGAEPICPDTLNRVGYHPSNWTTIHRLGTLFACPEAKILDFSLFIPVSDPKSESDILIKTAMSTFPVITSSLSSRQPPRPRLQTQRGPIEPLPCRSATCNNLEVALTSPVRCSPLQHTCSTTSSRRPQKK